MVRAAVVGLGWWGKHIVRHMAGSRVMTVTTALEVSDAHAAFAAEHKLRFTTRWDDVLKDPAIDAVILCTPHALHTEQVLAAAKAGKHVFCEKPLALSLADAERSVAACRAAGVVLGIGHERRFEPAHVAVRQLLRKGEFGTHMHVEANFSHDKLAGVPATDWRASTVDSPAAGMTAMGIHLTDLFIDYFGPVAEVYAQTSRRATSRPNGDVVSVLLRFKSGATGYLNAILATPLYLGMTVFGTEAWAEVRNHTHPDTPGPTTLIVQRKDGRREQTELGWEDAVRANLEAFAAAAGGGAPYPIPDAEKLANIATLEAIVTSAAENRPVAVRGA